MQLSRLYTYSFCNHTEETMVEPLEGFGENGLSLLHLLFSHMGYFCEPVWSFTIADTFQYIQNCVWLKMMQNVK